MQSNWNKQTPLVFRIRIAPQKLRHNVRGLWLCVCFFFFLQHSVYFVLNILTLKYLFAGTVYKIISNFVRKWVLLPDIMQPLFETYFITCQCYEVVLSSIQYEVLPEVQWCYGALLYSATKAILIFICCVVQHHSKAHSCLNAQLQRYSLL